MIYIVGIGVGNEKSLTIKALNALIDSDIIIGHSRQIDTVFLCNKNADFIEYEKISDILDIINKNKRKSISVLASGNPSLYGIADYIIKNTNEQVEIVSGISCVSYFFAKEKINMNDVYITSFHGREINEEMILISKKTAFFTDDKTSLYDIAQIYLKNNINPLFIIGENLSYENEKITKMKASEVKKDDKFYMYILISLSNLGE